MKPDYAIGTTIYIQFTTRAFATGVPTQLTGTPAISVLEENNATPITTGITLNVDRASVTGLNEVTIVASSGNGYENGKEYAAYISTGTVGGTSVVGEVVGYFSIEKQSALRPTTAGRTLTIESDGMAHTDVKEVAGTTQTAGDIIGRIGANSDASTDPSVASGTLFSKIRGAGDDLDTIEGQTDDIGAAGAGLTGVPWNAAWDTEVESEVNDALVANNLDHLAAAAVVGTDVVDNSIIAKMVSKSATADWDSFTNTTDSLEAVRDKETDIETDTAEIGIAGAGLTALGDTRIANLDATISSRSTITTAQVNAEVDAAFDTAIPVTPTPNSINERVKAIDDKLPSGSIGDATAANQTTIIGHVDTEIASILSDLSTLLTRLSAARAGYLDNLSGGAVALQASVDDLEGRLTAVRAGYLDNLNGHVPQTGDSFIRLGVPAGLSVSADVAAVKVDTVAIKTKTDQMNFTGTDIKATLDSETVVVGTNNDKTGYALTSAERDSIADAHLDRTNAIETGLTPRQAARLGAAADAGKVAGMATSEVTIRNAVADSKVRVTATVDANGNRTAVSTDVT